MQNESTIDVTTKLLNENDEYRELHEEHIQLKSKVDELKSKKYLTPEEDLELKQLKKLKLAGKDRMEQMVLEAKAN